MLKTLTPWTSTTPMCILFLTYKSDTMLQKELNRFPSCLSVVLTIPSATSKLKTTAFVPCV